MFGGKIYDLGPITFSYVSQFYILSLLVKFSFIFMPINFFKGDWLQMDKQACAVFRIR